MESQRDAMEQRRLEAKLAKVIHNTMSSFSFQTKVSKLCKILSFTPV